MGFATGVLGRNIRLLEYNKVYPVSKIGNNLFNKSELLDFTTGKSAQINLASTGIEQASIGQQMTYLDKMIENNMDSFSTFA